MEDEPEDQVQHSVVSFRGRLSNPNILACGLRGISNGKRDQHVHVEILPDEGIRFLMTDSTKALQGCATVSEKHFEEWVFRDSNNGLTFRINLAILIDCISMLGSGGTSDTGLQLEYEEEAGTLSLQLVENGGALTECKIRTLYDEAEDDQTLDFAGAFRAAESVNKAVLPSDSLKDAFQELCDLQGVSIVTLTIENEPVPMLRLSTEGESGVCFIDFGREAFSLFDAPSSLTFHYRLNLLQRALKPLSEADKTFLRINSEGILSFQHLIRQPDSQKTYVDFFLLACEESDSAEAQIVNEEKAGDD